jgi:hypothetical protein
MELIDDFMNSRWNAVWLYFSFSLSVGILLTMLPGQFFYGILVCMLSFLYLIRTWLIHNSYSTARKWVTFIGITTTILCVLFGP